MRKYFLSLAIVLLAVPAMAEIGPCKPDSSNGVTCGEGAGAARLIDGTTSPSKRLALAWRSPGHPTTEMPDPYAVENLLIRLADGAVLWSAKGDYWNTGAGRVNHYEANLRWSPDSRLAVAITDFRWETPELRLFAIGTGDKITVLDLKPIFESAVRKELRRAVKNEASYDFAIFGSTDGEPPRLTIDKRGLIKAVVQMEIARPETTVVLFDVAFQVDEKAGALGARQVSIRRSRIKAP